MFDRAENQLLFSLCRSADSLLSSYRIMINSTDMLKENITQEGRHINVIIPKGVWLSKVLAMMQRMLAGRSRRAVRAAIK